MSTDACSPQVTGESGATTPDVNLADLVRAAAERGPDHPALIDIAGHEMNWSELDAAVTGFGRRLLGEGVRPGDRVGLALHTGFEFCVALFAVFRVGAVAVPLPPSAPGPELRRVLGDSGARVLITVRGGEPDGHGDSGVTELDPPTGDERADRALAQAPADLAVLCYTSGTSGPARGAMLPHSALLANVRQCARLRPMPVNAADRVLLALPMYHAFGLGPGLLQVAAVGATAVLLPHFDADEALTTIARHRVTCVVGVPPMYRAWLRTPPNRLREAMSTVRLLTSGAAPLGADVATAVRSATGLDVFEGYGLTETGPVLTTTLAGGRAKPGSVGRALPGVQLRLVDADGSPMDEADGDTGRVAVRGANLFRGYWPDGAHGPDAEGWFRTGDVGYFDDEGDLRLVDRATDLIIVNGFNVYPREIELALAELAGVRESAVVGVPDEAQGESIKAVVVTEPGAELTPAEVRAHCAARLAKFKVPGEVVFASELPHSPTGKIARRSLRAGTT